MKILFDKDFNAALNKSFLEGYEKGKEQGKREALLAEFTPNEIRKMINLPPLKGE